MIDQETLGAAIGYVNQHGGGGGTSNYNDLTNKPQINGTTLSGNKSLSDLGIMPQTGVVANPSDEATTELEKIKVGNAVYSIPEGGSTLEAGDYIDITEGVISVKKEKGEYLLERYVLQSTGGGAPKLVVKKYIDSELISTNEYANNTAHVNIDDTLEIWYSYNPYNWHYKLLVDGVDHSAGYEYEFSYEDTTEYPVDFHISAGDSTNLVTKGDLAEVATSGSYADLTGLPTLGTASSKDVPATGDASSSQVVLGSDSRLTDSRPASDVSSWAKQSTKPTYTSNEVGAIATTQKGVASGVAELDANGKVPSSQLPSYVDDVIEGYYDTTTDRFYTESTFENVIPPESGKSWVDVASNKSYRWTGSVYSRVDEGVQLGETSGSAYRGDRGKTAYDHSQIFSGNPHGTTKSDVGLGNVPNVSTNDQTPTFTEASTRNNIASGEKLSVILGKIQKFFNDLKTVAFSGSYNDLTDTPSLATVATSGSYADLSNKPENANTFQGTIAEWNQLTTAEKKAYDHASITGTGGGEYNVDKSTGDLVQTSGMPSEYPATQVMLSDGVTSVEEKIGNVRMGKLWENPNPTAEFAEQDITLSNNNYDLLLILYVWNISSQTLSSIVNKSVSFVLTAGLPSAYGSRNMVRYGNFVSNTVIHFTGGTDSVGASASTTNNNRCIPIEIYGINLT